MIKDRFKILFVLTPPLHPNQGGVQMTTCKLGRYFLSRGHHVAAFSFAERGHSEQEPIEIFHADEPGGHVNPRNLEKLGRSLDQFTPDIVINQMPYEHPIGKFLANRRDCLLIACLRNTLFSVKSNIDEFIEHRVPGKLSSLFRNSLGRKVFLSLHKLSHKIDLQRILSTYNFFVMFGPPNLDELEWFVPDFDQDKIRLIPNSIPKVLKCVPDKENRLLWLGRVGKGQKQADLIIPIWKRVCTRLPDWYLDVVGEGPYLENLRSQAINDAVPRINFHGRQIPDEFYRRASLFFMTSSFEGFPNTLIEAQSYGAIPIIFDSYPMASWIVSDKVNGSLAKSFDLDEIADRIVEMALHPQRLKFAACALENAQRFHIDHVGTLWQRFFETEMARKGMESRGKQFAGS